MSTLRLIYPQWQGAGTVSVAAEAPEFPLAVARRGYAVGSRVLAAVLPEHDGPTDVVPVSLGDEGLGERDGVEAKSAVVSSLDAAFEVLGRHNPERILTLGGECAVSVAPFSVLAERYGDDLAIVWVDSHPDVGTPQSAYPGFHAMAVSALLGHGDAEILSRLPATVDASRVALVGLHAWTDDDYPRIAEWSLTSLSPDDLRTSPDMLLSWLNGTGCRKVAIHLDVDVVDSTEVEFGLGREPGGLRTPEVQQIIHDVAEVADVVGFTVAEFIPRQVMHLQRFLGGMPLMS